MPGTKNAAGGEQLPAPQAQRLSRPSWKDSRLAVGVGLIALSTVGGALLVNGLDDSVEVLAAAGPLVPGQSLAADDVRPVRVRLPEGAGGYLPTGGRLPAGKVLREVRAGELVPASALGSPDKVGVKSVTVPIDPATAATLVRGSVVDVWVSRRRTTSGQAQYTAPTRMIQRALVTRVPGQGGGAFAAPGSGQTTAVQVLVPEAQVDKVIDAVNTEAKVTVVAAVDSPLRSDS